MAHPPDFHFCLRDMNQLRIFLYPLDNMIIHRRLVTSFELADARFYLGKQRLCDSVLPKKETSLTIARVQNPHR